LVRSVKGEEKKKNGVLSGHELFSYTNSTKIPQKSDGLLLACRSRPVYVEWVCKEGVMDEKQSCKDQENPTQKQPEDSLRLSRRNFLTLVGGASAAAALTTVRVAKLSGGEAEAAELSAAGAPTNLTVMSASRLARLIRNRGVSSVEVVQAYLNRIDEVNPQLNAVVQNRGAAALVDAQAADTMLAQRQLKGPLHGALYCCMFSL
jgi:Amidase